MEDIKQRAVKRAIQMTKDKLRSQYRVFKGYTHHSIDRENEKLRIEEEFMRLSNDPFGSPVIGYFDTLESPPLLNLPSPSHLRETRNLFENYNEKYTMLPFDKLSNVNVSSISNVSISNDQALLEKHRPSMVVEEYKTKRHCPSTKCVDNVDEKSFRKKRKKLIRMKKPCFTIQKIAKLLNLKNVPFIDCIAESISKLYFQRAPYLEYNDIIQSILVYWVGKFINNAFLDGHIKAMVSKIIHIIKSMKKQDKLEEKLWNKSVVNYVMPNRQETIQSFKFNMFFNFKHDISILNFIQSDCLYTHLHYLACVKQQTITKTQITNYTFAYIFNLLMTYNPLMEMFKLADRLMEHLIANQQLILPRQLFYDNFILRKLEYCLKSFIDENEEAKMEYKINYCYKLLVKVICNTFTYKTKVSNWIQFFKTFENMTNFRKLVSQYTTIQTNRHPIILKLQLKQLNSKQRQVKKIMSIQTFLNKYTRKTFNNPRA